MLEQLAALVLEEMPRAGPILLAVSVVYRRLQQMEKKVNVTGLVVCALAEDVDSIDADRVAHALHENGITAEDFRTDGDGDAS